jgi:hypothetical protein
MVAPTVPHALVEQHLRAGLVENGGEVAIVLLGEVDLPRV